MPNQSQPNIVFIMADDHASKAISAYGAGINETPHIDRIAKEGMLFNHCYVTNSICAPSRAAIVTGTYNHVNGVYTLGNVINNRLPNVAKCLRTGGYQTAMVGKWHLGEGKLHHPTGFDWWSVVPGQGEYFNPDFITMGVSEIESGYVTDLITDKAISWLDDREPEQPFFLMCHHKAPHRSWEFDPKKKDLYTEEIKVPITYDDDYKHRATAAKVAKMRVDSDMTYFDLGLLPPEGVAAETKIPLPEDPSRLKLIDEASRKVFTFETQEELRLFKYQRYMQRYLRCIASIDDGVGKILDYLDEQELTDNTIVIYTSDQGFFLGDHGWFDKRFMYEQSLQMPFVIRYPPEIKAGTVNDSDIICNVDFATTFLDFAQLTVPTFMQGRSFRGILQGNVPENWPTVAYHRYWEHMSEPHHVWAHYGVRDHRYKLIFWYNEGLGLPLTKPGGQPKEWELFDLQEDPLELFNVFSHSNYQDVVQRMLKQLDAKQAEVGDEPIHTPGSLDTDV